MLLSPDSIADQSKKAMGSSGYPGTIGEGDCCIRKVAEGGFPDRLGGAGWGMNEGMENVGWPGTATTGWGRSKETAQQIKWNVLGYGFSLQIFISLR